MRATATISTIGARNATAARTARGRFGMARRKWSGTRSWMIAASGAVTLNMERFGCQRQCLSAGLPTIMATGLGFRLGAGRGWTMPRGATRPFITDAGPMQAGRGVGYPGRLLSVLSMPRRWSRLWAAQTSLWEVRWVAASRWGGSRWGPGEFISPPLVPRPVSVHVVTL